MIIFGLKYQSRIHDLDDMSVVLDRGRNKFDVFYSRKSTYSKTLIKIVLAYTLPDAFVSLKRIILYDTKIK